VRFNKHQDRLWLHGSTDIVQASPSECGHYMNEPDGNHCLSYYFYLTHPFNDTRANLFKQSWNRLALLHYAIQSNPILSYPILSCPVPSHSASAFHQSGKLIFTTCLPWTRPQIERQAQLLDK